jgi:Excalibur calcium-binding domain
LGVDSVPNLDDTPTDVPDQLAPSLRVVLRTCEARGADVAACFSVGPAGAVAPPLFKNCTNVNRKYPHGVGKSEARDRTSGDPVTNFKHSNALYRLATSYNRGLDRDKDGIACE